METDRDLDLWNYLFHDCGIENIKGHVPGDIEMLISPGIGNREYFSDPGENFIAVLRNCTDCTVTDTDVEGSLPQPVYNLEAAWADSGGSLFDAWRDGEYVVLYCIIGELRMKYETVDLYLDSGRQISYEELEATVKRWWKQWREYWDQKRWGEFVKPLEEGGPEISVMSYTARKDPDGKVWVFTLIKNVGATPGYEPKLLMTATQNGQVVATGLGQLGPRSILNVGQTAPMVYTASGDIPPDASIEWATTCERAGNHLPKLTLTESYLTRDEAGNITAVGTIRNDGTSLVKGVRAVAAFLDASGEIFYSLGANTALSDLEPGQSTPFKIETMSRSSSMKSVQTYVTGYCPAS